MTNKMMLIANAQAITNALKRLTNGGGEDSEQLRLDLLQDLSEMLEALEKSIKEG